MSSCSPLSWNHHDNHCSPNRIKLMCSRPQYLYHLVIYPLWHAWNGLFAKTSEQRSKALWFPHAWGGCVLQARLHWDKSWPCAENRVRAGGSHPSGFTLHRAEHRSTAAQALLFCSCPGCDSGAHQCFFSLSYLIAVCCQQQEGKVGRSINDVWNIGSAGTEQQGAEWWEN